MERPRDALAEGTELAGYVIGRVLGRGGFGITYAAADALYPDIQVAIKEFLPAGLAVREAGTVSVHPASAGESEDFAKALKRFQDEARTLVALRHPHIVEAQRFIKANGTAYVVMKLEEGQSLGRRLGANATLPEAELGKIVPPLLDGLEAVHARHFLHRDVKPDNIFLRSADGLPVLLDFGAARQAMAGDRKTSLTEIVTPGYAPYEQYDRHSRQGTFTDIYALGATLYRCVTGQKPPDATTRVNAMARKLPDPMPPAQSAAKGRYAPALLDAIDRSLAVFETERPQTVAEFRALIAPEAQRPGDTLNLARAEIPPVPAPAAPAVSHNVETRAPQGRPRRAARTIAAALAALAVAGGAYYAWSEYRADQAQADAKTAAETARRGAEAEAERARLDAEAKRRAEEEARKRAEDESRKKAEEERLRAEAEARRKAEEERKRIEEEARKRAEEEREREEAETKRKAEEEARKRAEEEREREEAEAKRRAEDEARRRAEEERARAEEERRRKIEPDWKLCTRQTASDEDRQFDACTRLIGLGLPDSELAEVYANRADASNVLAHYKQGLADADNAIRLDAGNLRAHNARGNALHGMRQYRAALAAYDKALSIRDDAAVYANRGRIYAVLGNREAAIRDLRQAHRLGDTKAAEALRRLGVTP